MHTLEIDPHHPASADVLVPRVVRVRKKRRETRDVFTLWLDAPDAGGTHFAPGQFNMLYAFGVGEAAISVAGNPLRADQVMHTIRAVGTVTDALSRLKAGDTLGLRGPYGSVWPLDACRGKDIVLVGGGIGLAPLRPVILAVLAQRERFGRLIVLHGARTPGDLLYTREYAAWASRTDVTVRAIVDRAEHGYDGPVGVVTRLIDGLALAPEKTVAMVCGPEIMMRFAARSLVMNGVAPADVHVSLERGMACAVGFCGHCQMGPWFVCRDGPVLAWPSVEPWLSIREL